MERKKIMTSLIKKITALTLAGACLVSVTACSSQSTTTSGGGSTTAPATTEPPATFNEQEQSQINEIEVDGAEKLENPLVTTLLAGWDLNPEKGKPKSVELEMFENVYGGKIENINCIFDERFSRLATLVASDDAPDMFSAGDLDVFPKGVYTNIFQPMDDIVEYDSDLWAPMKSINDKFVFNDGHYVAAVSADCGVVMIYNRKRVEENNLDDPADLLEEGKWDWDSLYSMMVKFCDNDEENGALDGWWFESAISLTTGVPYIDVVDGTIVQNLDNALIEKAQNYMLKLKTEKLPVDKAANGWQVNPQAVKAGKTLFYPVGIWALYTSNFNEDYGEYEDIMFVPMPKCPYVDDYYLPAAITGFSLCAGAKNPEGVGAYLKCAMLARDDETAKEISKKQLFEDYHWNQDMYDMQQKVVEMTAEHPMFEFYTAVSAKLNDLINNPMKETFNNGVSWTQTKESMKAAVQGEIDKVNADLEKIKKQ